MKRRPWTPMDDAQLTAIYADTPTAEIARLVSRSVCAIYARARKLSLEKSEAYRASPAACRLRRGDNVGARFRYLKGHVPANKGTRRPGFRVGRMGETQFKAGQPGWNHRPVGSTRLVDGYVYRKISDVRHVTWTVNWKPEHVLVWETAHGTLRAGRMLAFKNGNKQDVRIENLECISRRDNMLRNTVHNLPEPLKKTVQLLGVLNRKINKIDRRDREEQDRRSA